MPVCSVPHCAPHLALRSASRTARSRALRRLVVLLLAAAASACAASPPPAATPSASSQETSAMTASTAPPAAPRLNAEQTLRRLLDLVRDTRTVADIDAAGLSKAFGVDFATAEGRLGYSERVAAGWWSSIELDPSAASGPRLEVAFRPEAPGTYPPLTDICALDYDRFAAGLTAMGLSHRTYRGEHNRMIHESFEREGLNLTVYTRGEADSPPEKITHACVLMVLVQ